MSLQKNAPTKKQPGGPTSQEGREKCSQNSTTHGCTSKKVFMPGESEADYKQCWETWFGHYQALSSAEYELVRQVVEADWRMRRSERNLTAFEHKLFSDQPDPALWTDEQLKRLGLFKRYYTADGNAFQKALRLMQQLKKAEKQETLINDRIVESVIADLSKPKTFQDLKALATKTLKHWPLPDQRSDGGCTCPPCQTLWTITEWKHQQTQQATAPEGEPNVQ